MRTLLKRATTLLLTGVAMLIVGQGADAQRPDPNEARARVVSSLIDKAVARASLLRKSDPPMFGRNGPCVRHDQDLCGVDWRTVGVPA